MSDILIPFQTVYYDYISPRILGQQQFFGGQFKADTATEALHRFSSNTENFGTIAHPMRIPLADVARNLYYLDESSVAHFLWESELPMHLTLDDIIDVWYKTTLKKRDRYDELNEVFKSHYLNKVPGMLSEQQVKTIMKAILNN